MLWISFSGRHPALAKVGVSSDLPLVEKNLTYRELQNIKEWIYKRYGRMCRMTASKVEDYLNFTDKDKERRATIGQAVSLSSFFRPLNLKPQDHWK